MAERFLTLTQFEDLMQSTLVSILQWGDDEMSPSKKNDVRISWPEEGQPAWKIDENIVFLKCYEVDNQYNRQREVEDTINGENFDREISYTRVWEAYIIIYGKDSYENSQTIRDGLFAPEHRLTFSKNHLHMVHDIAAPRRAPEYFQGRWWERIDMSVQFYESVVRKVSIPAIQSIDVIIYEGDEGKKIAEINNE